MNKSNIYICVIYICDIYLKSLSLYMNKPKIIPKP